MITVKDITKKIKKGELSRQDVIMNGWMCSVTERISKIHQPRGGYINPKEFEIIYLDEEGLNDLNSNENISPSLIGITVDYLTRFMSGTPVEEAFKISEKGATNVNQLGLFYELLFSINGLDDDSIIAATKVSGYDSAYRAGIMAFTPIENIEPDIKTIENIRKMVQRSLTFLKLYGPKVLDGLTFEGGYTGYVCKGDGDFLTKDTLWDFKVTKNNIQSKHTLQLLMYWRMGIHSIHPEYKNIKYLGIYNPRKNIVYRLDVNKISSDVIKEVETKVIGY